MSVVAPISSAGVALPVVVGIATGNRPSADRGGGPGVDRRRRRAGLARGARRRRGGARRARTAIVLALLSALGFGGFFVLTDAPADASVPWTLVSRAGRGVPVRRRW